MLKNSTVCPQSASTCFVWISEHTGIFTLCSVNLLDFITEKQFVYCAVRLEYFKIIQLEVSLEKFCVKDASSSLMLNDIFGLFQT
jgi:hypothetical protein